MFARFSSFLLLALCARGVSAQPAAPPFTPTAAAYVVMDIDSGRVLDSRNPDTKLFPASTTKILTSLVAFERGNLNQIIRASKLAADTGESGIDLLEGENHTLRDLLRAAMIRSANDACVSIAEGVSGSQGQFMAQMNARAKQLGARNTNFVNPHGLHDPNHFTTARDLAIISRAGAQVPFLNQIAREKTAEMRGNWRVGPKRLLINRNKLLWRWPACDGFKTGYTRQAGNCLVSTATQIDPATGKPWRLLCVTLKSRAGFSYPDSQGLLQRAFASFRPEIVAPPEQVLYSGSIRGGAFPLEAFSTNGVRLPLAPRESRTLERRIELLPLKAPLQKGQRVGNAVYLALGKPIVRVPLLARDEVPQTLLARAVPSIGERVSTWHPAARFAIWGVFCALFALVLLRRRAAANRRRKRRAARSPRPFEPVALDAPPRPRG
jgi:D-alanyl-D-alanine carboxypeptidase (penicillin-binding protein 5/6)